MMLAGICLLAAFLHGAEGVRGSDNAALVQRCVAVDHHEQLSLKMSSEDQSFPTWVTGPYGDCSSQCQQKTRTLRCAELSDGSELPFDACNAALKPITRKTCSCDLEQCVDGLDCSHQWEIVPTFNTDADHSQTVGCYQLDLGDAPTCPEDGAETDVFDDTCFGWTLPTPCRSGFAFYRNCSAVTVTACSRFCTGKGMDLSAVIMGRECRCGASLLNGQIWHQDTPNPSLSYDFKTMTHADSIVCPVLLRRYIEPLESGGVSIKYRTTGITDVAYVDSIVAGRRISPELEEHRKEEHDKEALGMVAKEGRRVDPQWTRSCWPSTCGPGRGPWQTRTAVAPTGVNDVWEEYVTVTYSFAAGLDATRKEAFRDAVTAWHTSSCIVLKEEDPAPDPSHHITVGIYDTGSCYLSGMGWGTSSINLGWCNDLQHTGNMIHEIGHALGMNHEQKRSDAQAVYHGEGPHLTMFWANVPASWVPQYLPDDSTYIGSADDGPNDPHTGYADYDFGSIMHYGASNRFDTIPSSSKSLVGQRLSLATGDINQMLDMYQCKLKSYGGTTTATSTLPPVYPTTLTGTNFCSYISSYNTQWTYQGTTASGMPYYQSTVPNVWLLYEPECGAFHSPKWVIQPIVGGPSLTATSDLNGDGDTCSLNAYFSAPPGLPSLPVGTNTWTMYCGSELGWTTDDVTLHDSPTAPPTPAPPTPAPPTPAPPTPAPP
eukprot:CAMPEP_0171171402 /NCGR_PEP_ID=MMETSP0790-20130122/9199_1 /TAXON_ID=2925 /ORGANISM="Alexandrium catenella, Strain OF101" /LENGTH=713 /DNA_ID=CAMNT_0011636255 /DNA_START=45 /DNA_END=2183 /DNA_ORIENTATION=+